MKVCVLRYHSKVWMPAGIHEMVEKFFDAIPNDLGITYHGCEQLLEDSNTIVPMPTKEELQHSSTKLVEAYELCSKKYKPKGILQKIVIRIIGDEEYDYTYVVSNDGFVVSCWSNKKTDQHETLDMSKYYIPE